MKRISIEMGITLDGVEHQVKTIPADIVRAEAQNKGKTILREESTFTDMMLLAWACCKRLGITQLPFESFVEKVEDFGVMSEEDGDELPPQKDTSKKRRKD